MILDNESGLCPYPLRQLDGICFPHDLSRPPSRLFDVLGDQRERGPVFNYARVFTHRHLVVTVRRAAEEALKKAGRRKSVSGVKRWNDGEFLTHLEGDEAQTAKYCGLEDNPIWAYPEFAELDLVWRDIATASVVAMLLQWGTTGMAARGTFLCLPRGKNR